MPRAKSATTKSASTGKARTSKKGTSRARKSPAIKVINKKPIDTEAEVLEVVDSNLETDKPVEAVEETSDTVCLACSLPHGVRFDDVPNGRGGVKTVVISGVNAVLRGKSMGVLMNAGKAVAVVISRKDWEYIKARHGKERAFIGRNGLPPCILEMKDKEEFKARQDEVKSMRHGLEPIDPRKVGVTEAVERNR